MNAKLVEFVNRVQDLPAVPAVAASIAGLVEQPNTSADDLRKVIERDPGLATRILKIANSSLYGFSRQIETLQHAIAIIGFRAVRNVVMAASLKGTFKRFGLAEKILWEHATVASGLAAALARYGSVQVDRDEAFTAGLLHDLGKIALSNSAPDVYQRVMERVYNEGRSFVDVEREELGFDHAELGAEVAAKWKLPAKLQAAILHHHSPDVIPTLAGDVQRLTAVVAVTTACCTRVGIGRRAPVQGLDLKSLPTWSLLDLTPADVEPILTLAMDQVKESMDAFA
ncbi:MAG TPA: HDOD domain-containing protein [Myxococcota bacterium]|nr:HDOD domain-containing protein [Myxococcota bacterium]